MSVFDDESNQIRGIMSGSTRFAGYAPGHGPDLGHPISDLAILQRALQALKNFIFTAIRAAEYSDVLEPSKVERGTKLRLLRNCKHKGLTIPVGTAGVVFWSAAYGKFYDKGYNRPGRDNTRVGLTLADGSTAYIALSACRLDREPDTDTVLQDRAWELAQNCQFSKATGEKHAWDSENFALALYQKAPTQETVAA
ncbi:hypothetical protein [Edaphobacter modestus]|uniref:hypothetical protein n=1 Tax=Edaphobacter modestus TaxID=388466 RepID=UPI00102B63E5|nr:hypothetical protein [Edaphobacter modestus]